MAFITHLTVPQSKKEEETLRAQGYLSVPGNLNKGTRGEKIYLWYKRGGSEGITSIQISFNKEMTNGLKVAEYNKINKNLNAGNGGDEINLWFKNRSTEFDVPIVQLHVTTEVDDEAEMFVLGWERLACDLNRNAGGNRIHLWVQRERPTYICEIKATADYADDGNNFSVGWNRVDENTNRGTEGSPIFIWYRQTRQDLNAIKNMDVSINADQYRKLDRAGYKDVKLDLNKGTGGNEVFLWYKQNGNSEAIKAVTVLVNTVIDAYEKTVPVKGGNLNEGNHGDREVLYYYPN